MSVDAPQKALTPASIRARKGGEPLVCLTAYTAPMARLVDAHADLILVGDSLGMVVHGLPSTVGVTLEMMILHGRAVRRGAARALIVVDLPFGILRGRPRAGLPHRRPRDGRDRLRRGQARGRPHDGRDHRLPGRPRHPGDGACRADAAGGQRHRRLPRPGPRRRRRPGRSPTPQAVAEAGAFAVVLEKVAEPLARRITEAVPIPTIGIGASAACDGQVLVLDDMLGLFADFRPSFVRRYAELGAAADAAIAAYAADVRARRFPGARAHLPGGLSGARSPIVAQPRPPCARRRRLEARRRPRRRGADDGGAARGPSQPGPRRPGAGPTG